jgi:hypothetical protein
LLVFLVSEVWVVEGSTQFSTVTVSMSSDASQFQVVCMHLRFYAFRCSVVGDGGWGCNCVIMLTLSVERSLCRG